MITAPGVYDIAEADYHADPVQGGSLSSTTARMLLPPSVPALVQWRRDHPEHKDAWDLGSVAHALVLGTGSRFVEVKADSWRTKDAQEQRDAARAAGLVPLLSKDLRAAERMADAVLTHPTAGRILQGGAPERTLAWQDGGTWCRAMLDWWPDPDRAWRPIIGDLKTSASANPQAFAKSCAEYGYHQQAAWYSAGYAVVHDTEPPPFVFIVVQKDPPHLVATYQLPDHALDIGRERNRRALDVWQECRASGVWPGYSDDVELLAWPRWATA